MTDAQSANAELKDLSATEMLDITVTGVLIFAPDGILTYANPAALAFLPFMAQADQRPADLQGFGSFIPKLKLTGGKNQDCRVEHRWLRCSLQRLLDNATVIELTDITDLKQSEGTLVNARDMALLADRAKSEFLANMTHELRTPLNAVIGFAEVLRDELYGPIGRSEYKDFVADIHNSGRHLLAIIDDILDLSKIEIGRRELQPEEMDIARTISSATRMIERRAEAAGIAVHIELDENLPLLKGEERSIKQIILNLLSNAVKFTDSGGRITINASRNEDGGLDMSVTDTGIGIASDDQQRIFMPFVQVETGRPSQSSGAGLGLSLVKSLAEMHDAGIVMNSKPGRGTTFTVQFPREALGERTATGTR